MNSQAQNNLTVSRLAMVVAICDHISATTDAEYSSLISELKWKQVSKKETRQRLVQKLDQTPNNDLTFWFQTIASLPKSQVSCNYSNSKLIALPVDTLYQFGALFYEWESLTFGYLSRQTYIITQNIRYLRNIRDIRWVQLNYYKLNSIHSNKYDLFRCQTYHTLQLSGNNKQQLKELIKWCKNDSCYSDWFLHLLSNIKSLNIWKHSITSANLLPIDLLFNKNKSKLKSIAIYGSSVHDRVVIFGDDFGIATKKFCDKIKKCLDSHSIEFEIKRINLLTLGNSIPYECIDFSKIYDYLDLSTGYGCNLKSIDQFLTLIHDQLKGLKIGIMVKLANDNNNNINRNNHNRNNRMMKKFKHVSTNGLLPKLETLYITSQMMRFHPWWIEKMLSTSTTKKKVNSNSNTNTEPHIVSLTHPVSKVDNNRFMPKLWNFNQCLKRLYLEIEEINNIKHVYGLFKSIFCTLDILTKLEYFYCRWNDTNYLTTGNIENKTQNVRGSGRKSITNVQLFLRYLSQITKNKDAQLKNQKFKECKMYITISIPCVVAIDPPADERGAPISYMNPSIVIDLKDASDVDFDKEFETFKGLVQESIALAVDTETADWKRAKMLQCKSRCIYQSWADCGYRWNEALA